MKRLGLDFDNTLIRYDELFHKLAVEKKLIADSVPPKKKLIRDNLRQKGIEVEWTKLQGEVYGKRIHEAVAWEGMLEALSKLQRKGNELFLVSHKTQVPYLGPSYDLHAAARSWLIKQGFFSKCGLNWEPDHVFFELTMEEKIERIRKLECTHYVDDLPEILEILPNSVKKIFFCPGENSPNINKEWLILRRWVDLPDLLL